MKYCEEYAALLDAFADGECTPEEAARVREHLAGCAGCRAYLNEILKMKAAFPDPEDTEVPAGFADGVMAAVRADAAPRKGRTRRWMKVLLPLAACLAVAVAVRGLPGWNASGSVSDGTATAAVSDEKETAAAPAQSQTGTASDNTLTGSSGTAGSSEVESAPRLTSGSQRAASGGETAQAGTGQQGSAASQNTAPKDAAADPPAPANDSVSGSAADEAAEAPEELPAAAGEAAGLTAASGTGQEPWASSVSPEFGNQPLAAAAEPDGSTYEERLASLDAQIAAGVDENGFRVDSHTENGSAIAFVGELTGTPHQDQYGLYLYLADGTKADLPLPWSSGEGVARPDSMWFDGDAFVYEITFDSYSYQSSSEYHVQGTYHYTVDLTAQTISLDIR